MVASSISRPPERTAHPAALPRLLPSPVRAWISSRSAVSVAPRQTISPLRSSYRLRASGAVRSFHRANPTSNSYRHLLLCHSVLRGGARCAIRSLASCLISVRALSRSARGGSRPAPRPKAAKKKKRAPVAGGCRGSKVSRPCGSGGDMSRAAQGNKLIAASIVPLRDAGFLAGCARANPPSFHRVRCRSAAPRVGEPISSRTLVLCRGTQLPYRKTLPALQTRRRHQRSDQNRRLFKSGAAHGKRSKLH